MNLKSLVLAIALSVTPSFAGEQQPPKSSSDECNRFLEGARSITEVGGPIDLAVRRFVTETVEFATRLVFSKTSQPLDAFVAGREKWIQTAQQVGPEILTSLEPVLRNLTGPAETILIKSLVQRVLDPQVLGEAFDFAS